jgi:hypothetical protein
MPVEIREINIKATISEGEKPGKRNTKQGGIQLDKESIIAECVDRVMELLRLNQER